MIKWCLWCNQPIENSRKKYCNSKCREKYRYHNKRKHSEEYKRKQTEYAKVYYCEHKEDYKKRANSFRLTEKYKQYKSVLTYSGKEVYRGIQRRCDGTYSHLRKWYYDKGIKCIIELEDFLDFYWSKNECEICGVKLEDFNRNDSRGRTVDRVDSDGHYEINNIQLLCRSCNTKKSTTGGIKIGLKSGVFALLTAAHIESFKYMRQECHYLVVFVNDDEYLKNKKGFVVVPAEERACVLRSLKGIDEVIIYSGENEHKSIQKYKEKKLWRFGPQSTSIMFHSPEFIGRKFVPGKEFVDRVIYTPFYDGLNSTSDIMNRIWAGIDDNIDKVERP